MIKLSPCTPSYRSRVGFWELISLCALALCVLSVSVSARAQTTVSTGSIVGTVTDPSGAVVGGAKIVIKNTATNQEIPVTANSTGAYNSGALEPGTYRVQVTAKGFSGVAETLVVQVGNTATFNPRLQLGQESTVVEVQASEVQVNTEQAVVQGVITADQIENLPVNGRNFLDLAQLEPGVQIQDGTNFDPTKVGYSSISFGGRFGRTARIEVDGVDVSDETVGTTTQDIPASAIEEFQLSQSKLDLSTGLSSSGAVNVTTKSGTNAYHGEAFGYFRDHSAIAAALPTPAGLGAPAFQRDQFGGRFGGPVIKDKLFFFMDGERTLNDLQAPVALPAPFTSDSGFFNAPFRESELLGKVDYQLTKSAKLFYRYEYFANLTDATFFASSFQVYSNKDDSRSHVLGLDFNTGSVTHSIRFQYLKFQNQIKNGDAGQPFSSSGLSIFNGPFAGGPNYLAPQSTPQSDHEYKYDGSKIFRNHVIRFGTTYNHIQGGGFAAFFSVAPVVVSGPTLLDASCAPDNVSSTCPAGPDGKTASNPLNYDVAAITMGNGIGFATSQKAFGFPAGGLGPDNRIALYIGDSWKVKSNFTVELGLRYVRDTGRNDSDLAAIPALNGLVSDFPNLGARINQPNLNFAPQIGLAWDPFRNGKTVIRAGAGLYYENTIWNNVLFDRPTREATGAFLQVDGGICAGPGAVGPPIPVGNTSIPIPQNVCAVGNSNTPITIGAAAPAILALIHQYQAASPFDPNLQNPGYVPGLVQLGLDVGSNVAPATFAPNFQTPRSVQMNIGIQRELHRGTILSVDFVRNVETHPLMGIDLNHTGDSRYFNLAGAQAAISATNNAFGCGTGFDSASIDCAIAAGAQMKNYAGAGLDTTAELGVSGPGKVGTCPLAGCAFPGLNPNVSNLNFLLPIGRSVYNALDMKLVENVTNPMKGVKSANFQISYSLSRFLSPGGANTTTVPPNYNQGADQDFVIGAPDNANPLRYMGPSLLDRTHQLSFGGSFALPWGFQTGLIAHFYSPLSAPLVVPNSGEGFGEIFRTDFTGDGTTQDFVPGSKNGAFMRSISPSGLAGVINNYNQTVAGKPTPAGQVLIANGLFTASQLATPANASTNYPGFGGVAPSLAAPVGGAVGLAWLRDVDLSFGWKYTIKERVTIQPGIGFFNVFNFANFDLPPNVLSPYLTGAAGSVGGTTYSGTQNVRVGAGTGVYGLGSPRVAEFNLKISF